MNYQTRFLLPIDGDDPMTRDGELPFVPHAGLWIDTDSSYHRVESVYFQVATGRLEVWFDDPCTEETPKAAANMRKLCRAQGWLPPGVEFNPWLPEMFNVTKQGEIFRDDPERAKRLAKEAGVNIREKHSTPHH